jgi:hypothetical protein
VPKEAGDESITRDAVEAGPPAADPARLSLEMRERGAHRSVVAFADRTRDVVVPDGIEHRHGLRRRERQVETRHRIRPGRIAQLRIPGRCAPLEQRSKVVPVDLAIQAEQPCTEADPLAVGLAGADVVVLAALRHAVDVVATRPRLPRQPAD